MNCSKMVPVLFFQMTKSKRVSSTNTDLESKVTFTSCNRWSTFTPFSVAWWRLWESFTTNTMDFSEWKTTGWLDSHWETLDFLILFVTTNCIPTEEKVVRKIKIKLSLVGQEFLLQNISSVFYLINNFIIVLMDRLQKFIMIIVGKWNGSRNLTFVDQMYKT
jgi:hypothetical protein